MPNDLISDLVSAAHAAKLPVEVVYFGGTQPGTRRHLLPVRVYGRMFDARCLATDQIKTFRLDRVAIPSADSAIPMYVAHDADGVVVERSPPPQLVKVDGIAWDNARPSKQARSTVSWTEAWQPLVAFCIAVSAGYYIGAMRFGWPSTGIAYPLYEIGRRVHDLGAAFGRMIIGLLR